MKTGIELIAIEREEQLKKHGKGLAADVIDNPNRELAKGASALINGNSEYPKHWDKEVCLKMLKKPYKERLIIAGALIAAEIDRLHNAI